TAYVSPQPGPNFRIATGVVGQLGTAVNSNNPDATCQPTIKDPGESTAKYYAPPCVADSVMGGTDQWIMHSVNAGTTDAQQVTFFEELPAVGDSMLVAGTPRGSTYRPQILANSLKVLALDYHGNDITPNSVDVEVSFSGGACAGTWVAADPVPCAAGPWALADAATDWSQVRALRVSVQFDPATPLGPASTLDVTYSTVNVPEIIDASGVSNGGVPRDALLATDQLAWEQYGAVWVDATSPTTTLRRTPPKIGVALRASALEVNKAIAGSGAANAPQDFEALITCKIGWTDANGVSQESDLTFGGKTTGSLPLSQKTGLTGRIDRIPLGAVCAIAEAGKIGSFGEAARETTASTITLNQLLDYSGTSLPTTALDPQQVVTLTNIYIQRAADPDPDPAPTLPELPITGFSSNWVVILLPLLAIGLLLIIARRRIANRRQC
ncbi:MAG: DUF5979 domain-containing protein, partial [Propionibacteriaceae bacterium]|nr:DUF5979 domain-containing protein [Propionibacteriaceae bacterium]